MKIDKNIVDLLSDFDSEIISAQALVDWAASQASEDKESDSLSELAWLNNTGRNEARILFINALEELEIEIPNDDVIQIHIAKKIAKRMLEGKKDLNEGCSELCEVSRNLDSPSALSAFEFLAHEQYDHENLGITSESIKPEILSEARKLVNET